MTSVRHSALHSTPQSSAVCAQSPGCPFGVYKAHTTTSSVSGGHGFNTSHLRPARRDAHVNTSRPSPIPDTRCSAASTLVPDGTPSAKQAALCRCRLAARGPAAPVCRYVATQRRLAVHLPPRLRYIGNHWAVAPSWRNSPVWSITFQSEFVAISSPPVCSDIHPCLRHLFTLRESRCCMHSPILAYQLKIDRHLLLYSPCGSSFGVATPV